MLVLLDPALLTALVITGTFGKGARLVIDERALGVEAAVAIALRAPVLLAALVAALALPRSPSPYPGDPVDLPSGLSCPPQRAG